LDRSALRHVFQNSITIALYADATRVQLQSLAGRVAGQWAKARSDQDRLNWARWVVSEQKRGNQRDDLDDYPPVDRAVPVGPEYAETKRVHPDVPWFKSSGP
jgi:hypothetical protein